MQPVSKERRTMKKLITLTFGLILITGIGYAAFDPHTPIVLTPHIGTVEIVLMRTVNPSQPVSETVKFTVIVDDQFHNDMDSRSGNLAPHLTSGQITQLQNFMDAMWTKAEDEILP